MLMHWTDKKMMMDNDDDDYEHCRQKLICWKMWQREVQGQKLSHWGSLTKSLRMN